jgi:hypothetical protein
MAHFDPGDRRCSPEEGMGADGAAAPPPLPAAAQHTLDRIAEALGATTALLRSHGSSESTGDVRMAEATALLQAFIRIEDPAVRRRCVALVQQAAGAGRGL